MHIPDGILSPAVMASTGVLSAGAVTLLWRKIKQQFYQQAIPKIAVMAAFLFVAQMINVPIAVGASGHLLGGLLAALLLGPAAGMFVLTLVIMVQMLLFQDGGLAALGANVLNMAIMGVGSGYIFYSGIQMVIERRKWGETARNINIFLSAWLAVEVSAIMCGLELAFSGVAGFGPTVGLLAGVHA
ncbi:MAG: energy-coupling factor ABC transporter permease, partial [Calditrichia bacterium]